MYPVELFTYSTQGNRHDDKLLQTGELGTVRSRQLTDNEWRVIQIPPRKPWASVAPRGGGGNSTISRYPSSAPLTSRICVCADAQPARAWQMAVRESVNKHCKMSFYLNKVGYTLAYSYFWTIMIRIHYLRIAEAMTGDDRIAEVSTAVKIVVFSIARTVRK